MKFHQHAPPDRGQVLWEQSIPSDLSVKTPFILGIVSKVIEAGLIDETRSEKLEFCLEEAVKNAILHGNHGQPDKSVSACVFLTDHGWGIEIADEGAGFGPEDVSDPDDPGYPWRESGRGIHMMDLIADDLEFFNGGRALVVSWSQTVLDPR